MKGVAIIAYCIDLCGTFLGQIGYLLMKKALLHAEDNIAKSVEIGVKKVRSPYCTWRYIIGLLLLVISALIHAATLPFVDLVLISTLTAVGIIISTLLAIRYLKEKFICKYDLPSFILIILGCTTIVALSNQEETEYSPERIKGLLTSAQYAISGIFYFIVAVSTYCIYR